MMSGREIGMGVGYKMVAYIMGMDKERVAAIK